MEATEVWRNGATSYSHYPFQKGKIIDLVENIESPVPDLSNDTNEGELEIQLVIKFSVRKTLTGILES